MQILLVVSAFFAAVGFAGEKPPPPAVGDELDRYKEVPAYYNGEEIEKSQGRHNSKSGYYYGQKWQCVEYVKRFLREVKGLSMPDGYGHAKDFFDGRVKDGGWNEARGMVQYRNGSRTPPEPDDLLVFDGEFGHVGIITSVTEDSVEIIQQNRGATPREKHSLVMKDGRCWVGKEVKPLGWLRVR